ncbi:MAG: anti-sigma factor antagonist [Oscillospiraceae bacterium]
MAVEIKVTDETVIAYLMGDIDHHKAKPMREKIDEAIYRNTPKELILDFREVGFMDSSGIGLVMGRYKIMQEMGGKIEISSASGSILKLMALGGIEKIISLKNCKIENL